MDMQETLEDANGCCLVGIVHQWQVPIKTCCYIDENGRDCAMTRIESVKSLYGLEKQSIAPCM
jgi:hypothetical protein